MSPRKKRSEKLAEPPVVAKAPKRAKESPREVLKAFCPVCGHSIPIQRAIKSGYATVDHVDYFDNIKWDPDQPFGAAFYFEGRGRITKSRYLTPEDVPALFDAVKSRVIQALREYIDKGWIKQEELKDILKTE